ncbi:MAG: 3'(2'),5'-bisphosphate nucleotidase [Desulfatiglandales bacterium]
MAYEREREAAFQAVLKACVLCREVQSAHLARRAMEKMDGSPVTVADFGVQALVARHLMTAFPEDRLIGEEDSGQLRRPENDGLKRLVIRYVNRILPGLGEKDILGAIDRGNAQGGPEGRVWVLDPVDGTKGFLRGDQYAVALALMEEGEVILGVLGCPNLSTVWADALEAEGCLFVAVKGQGAFMRDLKTGSEGPVRVADTVRPSEALFVESVESNHSSHEDSARLAKILGVTREPVRMDGQGKYGLVARGDADVYVRIPTREMVQENIWDHAAGAVVVQEGGGRVTDLDGRPLDFSLGKTLKGNRGIIASNRLLHDAVLEAARQVTLF